MIENKKGKAGVRATTSRSRPGDFPLGSAKSRAAARAAILARRPQLTEYDEDCLLIEALSHYLQGTAWPDSKEMEKVPAWHHGWELIKSSPDFPKYLEALRQFGARKFGPSPFASMEFIDVYGRQPLPGDVLRYTDLKPSQITAEDVNEWRAVWQRRVPEYPFPFRHHDGFLFVRVADYVVKSGRRTFEGYEPVWNFVPQFRWAWVEDEALGSHTSWYDVERSWAEGTQINQLRPRIGAVQFCEDGTVKAVK